MEAAGRLIGKTELDNGLIVYFHDQSRPIAGGRWQVRLSITIPLEVKEIYFQECENPRQAFERYTAACGKTIHFQQEKVRNFIKDGTAETLLEKMKEEFLESNRAYLVNPVFARKVVMKQYREWEEKSAWERAHTEALRTLQ